MAPTTPAPTQATPEAPARPRTPWGAISTMLAAAISLAFYLIRTPLQDLSEGVVIALATSIAGSIVTLWELHQHRAATAAAAAKAAAKTAKVGVLLLLLLMFGSLGAGLGGCAPHHLRPPAGATVRHHIDRGPPCRVVTTIDGEPAIDVEHPAACPVTCSELDQAEGVTP